MWLVSRFSILTAASGFCWTGVFTNCPLYWYLMLFKLVFLNKYKLDFSPQVVNQYVFKLGGVWWKNHCFWSLLWICDSQECRQHSKICQTSIIEISLSTTTFRSSLKKTLKRFACVEVLNGKKSHLWYLHRSFDRPKFFWSAEKCDLSVFSNPHFSMTTPSSSSISIYIESSPNLADTSTEKYLVPWVAIQRVPECPEKFLVPNCFVFCNWNL